MKQAVLMEYLQLMNDQLHIEVHPDMGRQFNVIVLPMDHPIQPSIAKDEAFLLGAYSAATEDDPRKDAVWEKYVRD